MNSAVEVKGLKKSYGSIMAINDISFEVAEGEIFGVVGPNGAGKTTLIECLIGLRVPDSGNIRVLGMDPHGPGTELKQLIGVQLQLAALPERIKVWEALDLYSSYYKHSIDWEPLIEQWGLSEKRDTYFMNLSGGQKQRLLIAMALLNDPKIVFLDELTTGLDPQARRNCWDIVSAIRQRGTTVVLVSHFMDEAQYLCDRVAIVDQGKLVAMDTPAALIRGLKGTTVVRFSVKEPIDLIWLQQIPGVEDVEWQDSEIVVSGDGSMVILVAASLVEHGHTTSDFRTEQPNLEDVFLALTGRQIRE